MGALVVALFVFEAGAAWSAAQTRAREIAVFVHPGVRYQEVWPLNSPDVVNQIPNLQAVNDFNTLANFTANAPVFAYFADRGANLAHLTVVTGTASAPGHVSLVASNNSWDIQSIRTWDEFRIMQTFNPDGSSHFDGRFESILRITPSQQTAYAGGATHGSF